ncbi:hypothetical protein LBMAG48_05280 [Phycisphaerae bacterium]|nr:hypothetical protein LBMAG48_05280 [Phycisphaerae bacterium]
MQTRRASEGDDRDELGARGVAWVLRACGVMLWPARWRVLRENAAQAMVLIVLGWGYYGAFFIHAGMYEWRYFMPGFVVIVVGVAMMVRGLARKAAACQEAVA